MISLILQHVNRSWQRMEQNLPQPVAYTCAAGLNNWMIAIFKLPPSGGRPSVPVWRRQRGRAVQPPPLAFPASSLAGFTFNWTQVMR